MHIRSTNIPRQLRKWNSGRMYLLLAFTLWAVYKLRNPLLRPYFDTRLDAPSVNLVIAALQAQNTSWSNNLNITNLRVLPYIADNASATYHPRQSKGREAMIILTYLHDFYDELPDISIFTHADDRAWHNIRALGNSIASTLSNLDLAEVQRRNYLSLSIDWHNACPSWINMNMTRESPQYTNLKQEEPYMKAAFTQHFPNDTMPEVMSAPCCSQFAVTKAAIQRIPKSDYADFISYLLETELEDELSGRIWEHWWQYLFLKKAIDCPVEYKALCAGFHLCFEEEWEYEDYNVLAILKGDREGDRNKAKEEQAEKYKVDFLNWKIRDIEKEMEGMRSKALENGRDEKKRKQILGDDFYEPE